MHEPRQCGRVGLRLSSPSVTSQNVVRDAINQASTGRAHASGFPSLPAESLSKHVGPEGLPSGNAGAPANMPFSGIAGPNVLQADDPPQGWSPAPGRRVETVYSRDARFSSNPIAFENQGGMLTGPKYFAADFADPMPASEPTQEVREIKCGTWNLAGTCAKRVKTLISQMPECDLLVVQEFPKQPPGWKLLKGEVFHAALYQDHIMYRATGLFYDTSKFNLCKKIASPRGAWFLVQHKATLKQLWIGTTHLPNSEPREELLRLISRSFEIPNRKGYPAVLLGDFNIQFKWRESDIGVVPGVIEAKWAELRQRVWKQGFVKSSLECSRWERPLSILGKAMSLTHRLTGYLPQQGSSRA